MHELIVVVLMVTAVFGYDSRRHPACFEPMEMGPCYASIPRWFFNSEESKCEQFIYGGCQGNRNNFETLRACELKCRPVSDLNEDCLKPLKGGPCRAGIPRWYYNKASSKCQPFLWGGCQPNENNFLSLDECWRICFERK